MDQEGKNPLENIKILITRPEDKIPASEEIVSFYGGIPLSLPSTKIIADPDWKKHPGIPSPPKDYSWLVFSSSSGWKFFNYNLPLIEKFPHAKIAAVGQKTAEVIEREYREVDFIPSDANGENLCRELPAERGEKILFPRGSLGRRDIFPILEERGIICDELIVYRTNSAPLSTETIKEVLDSSPDVITFTSPSSVFEFFKMASKVNYNLPENLPIFCIGPVTGKALQKCGISNFHVAVQKDFGGMVKEIRDFFSKS